MLIHVCLTKEQLDILRLMMAEVLYDERLEQVSILCLVNHSSIQFNEAIVSVVVHPRRFPVSLCSDWKEWSRDWY